MSSSPSLKPTGTPARLENVRYSAPVRVFTAEDLVTCLTDAGFEIDHRWQPGKGAAVFIVAKTADQRPLQNLRRSEPADTE